MRPQRVRKLLKGCASLWVEDPGVERRYVDAARSPGIASKFGDGLTAGRFMSDAFNSEIDAAFCDVMARQAFMASDPVDQSEVPSSAANPIKVTIGFDGPCRGELRLMTSALVAMELAVDALGVDPDQTAAGEDSHDAMREVMNLTLGRLLVAVFGSDTDFEIATPCLESGCSPETWTTMLNDPATRCFMIDQEPALLALSVTRTDLPASRTMG